MDWARNRRGAWRGIALTLTVLALALKVLVPPGFMVATSGAPFPLVMCTGHGPLTLDLGDHGGSKTPTQKHSDVPCTGAGNITAPTPALTVAISEPYAVAVDGPTTGLALDLIPGRGLAAPPPPSHAPPFTLA